MRRERSNSHSPPGERLVDTRIGQYLLTRVISSGGMGIVYEAFQEQLQRTVAVKVLKHALPSRSARRRFEYEAQVLSRLRHPNIVQMIDAGTWGADDLPYFVMEYIPDGAPLNGYADRNGLSQRQRLELFAQVCDAVDHGHRKGIIHRDLKPGNILVDRGGQVKIIDFGVARAIDPDEALTTVQTDLAEIIGTVQYMSPEQCDADRHNLDTRSDVYALGVVLYELLCGKPPYDLKEAALLEAMRLVREEEPRRPSEIKSRIPGEVETIILKALEKEPKRRYQSVAEFGDDIARNLRGEVIRARPVGVAVRSWKWIKRNPTFSAAAAVVLLAACAFAAHILLWAYPRIVEEKKNLDEAYREITRLADVKRLAELESEARGLWPAHPEMVPAMDLWIGRARSLVERTERHRSARDALRRTARNEDRAARGTWTFDDMEKQWRHDTLADLVSGLTRLADRERGLLESMVMRKSIASTIVAESLEKHSDAWREAIASISNVTKCPEYGGLRVNEQVGFVPIGRDPNSGLWEFVHLQTGEIPERDGDGRLRIDAESGLVFVLLPGGIYKRKISYDTHGPTGGSPREVPYLWQIYDVTEKVKVEPFLLSKFEMTQAQWLRVSGRNPSLHGPWARFAQKEITLLHPVEYVSWNDCDHLLFTLGLRLPSESEWEYAARGGTTTPWWTGREKQSLLGAENLRDLCCVRHMEADSMICEPWDDGYVSHAPVGSFRPNPFGLHDVHGNVKEWCRDKYSPYFEGVPVDGTAYETEAALSRVHRGSSWNSNAGSAQFRFRNADRPNGRYYGLGVRPAASLQGME